MRTGLVSLPFFAFAVTAAFAQQPSETAATVAARKRLEKLNTVSVVFDMKEVREKNSLVRTNPLSTTKDTAPSLPEQQLVLTSDSNRLVVFGKKLRYECNHPVIFTDSGQVLQERAIAASDGVSVRKLRSPPTGGDRKNSMGIMSDVSHAVVQKYDFLYPLLLACNGIDGEICDTPISSYVVAGGSSVVNVVRCELYRLATESAELPTVEFWASSTEDYLPRRIRYSTGGKLTRQIDVTAFRDLEGGGKFPTEWTLARYTPAGKIASTRTMSVRDLVVNRAASDDEFTVKFPPGIDVEDVVLNKFYLVRDDGSLFEIDGPRADSDSIQADARSPWWVRNWWLLLGGALAVCGMAFLLRSWFHRRRLRSATTPK
jgi:hypothetical protein